MNNFPHFSIITPSLNRVEFIEEAIQSVLDQDYPYVEHLIIDGGSTDGTLDVLKRYPYLKVVSEPDKGIYDALNKGLRLASGGIIGLLNTDDYYESGVFHHVADYFSDHPETLAVAGAAGIFTLTTAGKRIHITTYPAVTQEQIWLRVTIGSPIINAWFFRKEIFDQLGGFAFQYRIAADREFLLRLALKEINFSTTQTVLYQYQQHTGSLTITPDPDPEMPQNSENLNIAESYINTPGIPTAARQILLEWHTNLTISQVFRSLYANKYRQAAAQMKHGWQTNPKWPIRFTQRALSGFQRKIKLDANLTMPYQKE